MTEDEIARGAAMVLVKEYRIPLPLTVEEYRIAQLFMIAKKSRQESHGEGSGVEILVNEPYENGPGPDGRGQYTHKVYHVGSHLPGWLKSLIPKSALSVEEEAWNAYPYTKTRFTCPFVEKFSMEVETYYFNDGGHQENVFKLSNSEMKQREVDLIDVVRDQLYGADYKEEEDPRKYVSQKTSRGPLGDNWINEYWEMCKDKPTPLPTGEAIMCAYKLCKVEFRYWGMQTKIEKFIHDVALRKTMLRAHRQAWAWMDEWWGLTIEDIRNIEKETQDLLAKKYGAGEDEEGEEEEGDRGNVTPEVNADLPQSPSVSSDRTPNLEQLSQSDSFRTSNDLGERHLYEDEEGVVKGGMKNINNNNNNMDGNDSRRFSGTSPKLRRRELNVSMDSVLTDETRKRGSWSRSGSRNTLNSQNQANWRMESIRRDSDSSGSDEEFFDCQEDLEETAALHKWSSLELLPQDSDTQSTISQPGNEADSIFSQSFMSRVAAERSRVLGRSMEASAPSSPSHSPSHQPGPCSNTVLLLVIHAGSVLDPNSALVLVYRKMVNAEDKNCMIQRPACQQVYNLFHPTDPLAVRLEPLLSARFSLLPPITIPRYTKYPLGDGNPTHLLECIQTHGEVFLDIGGATGSPSLAGQARRMSDASILSTMSGMADTVPLATINALSQRWWGTKRLDYALYCPEGLANFPTNSLPHLFHASYWESSDVIAFILRQLVRTDHAALTADDKDLPVFSPTQPREKWMKKRTSVKIKNVAANHRGNDVIVREGAPQCIQARFMYGPLDMVALSGEKVDIHIMRDPPGGDWQQISTEVTDKNGRISFTIAPEKALGYGMYPVKMIVRGDHTSATLYLTVVPPKTESVVFSIDGSFTASVSVTGRDPKVRAGAVDVVRHWQELGYLIIYVTGRPDMQQQKVVSWLAQHNFPHGLVSFADGLTRDPLAHKAEYLRGLIQDHAIVIVAAYGSSKDIAVYNSIGLKTGQIYIVGKASKKQHANAQVLSDGYAAHLSSLSALGKSRPARGNPQMVIPRGFFGLPGQNNALRRRRSAKRTTSFPVLGASASEGVIRSRGSSHSPHPNHMSMRR
ncbi:Protein retinal degeneration B [Penaeus vannamei]|uniref:Protein retinal degeneration B n=1 Tax=Penaeus vannamei TaxID=6689 RepID=A0A3R7Q442_PENVA|nr:Protein retinal degeneration B [Penaeus vannamei]